MRHERALSAGLVALLVSLLVFARAEATYYSSIPDGCIVMWSGTIASIPSGSGWQLCDGTNGTPDLRNSFVKCTAAGQDPGGTGGSATATYTPQGTNGTASFTPGGTVAWPAGVPTAANESAHTHQVTAAGTNANESAHTHGAGTLADATSGSTVKLFTASGSGVSAATLSGSTAAGSAHTHTFTGSAVTSGAGSAHTHTISWPAGVPTFSGSGGTVPAETFTGTQATIATEPVYFKLAFIMKTK